MKKMVKNGLELVLSGFLVSSLAGCIDPVPANDDDTTSDWNDDDSTPYDDDDSTYINDDDTVNDDDYTPDDDDTTPIDDDDTTPENQPPIAIAGGPYEVGVGEILQIYFGPTGTGSYDPDGKIVLYSVDWGDKGASWGPGGNFSRIYDSPGEYLLTLTVEDDAGAEDTNSSTVFVE